MYFQFQILVQESTILLVHVVYCTSKLDCTTKLLSWWFSPSDEEPAEFDEDAEHVIDEGVFATDEENNQGMYETGDRRHEYKIF